MKEKNAVTITVDSFKGFGVANALLHKFKRELGSFLSIIVLDECETAMEEDKDAMKRLLDGSDSLDNNICFFTTNHLDKVPETIKNRPSRIKECIEFRGIEDEVLVYEIMKSSNATIEPEFMLPDHLLRANTNKLKGKTIDEIKHHLMDLTLEHNIKTKIHVRKEVEIKM